MEFKVTIWLIGNGKVDPWYLWVYGSKETAIEEKLNARVQSSVIHCRCLIHFFHNSTQLPLKTCCFSSNLKLSPYHLTEAY
jgi:hypothetical protein